MAQVADYLSENRFQQILRYFHVSIALPDPEATDWEWYDKVDPLAQQLKLNFRKYFEEDSRNPKYFHSVRGVGYKYAE